MPPPPFLKVISHFSTSWKNFLSRTLAEYKVLKSFLKNHKKNHSVKDLNWKTTSLGGQQHWYRMSNGPGWREWLSGMSSGAKNIGQMIACSSIMRSCQNRLKSITGDKTSSWKVQGTVRRSHDGYHLIRWCIHQLVQAMLAWIDALGRSICFNGRNSQVEKSPSIENVHLQDIYILQFYRWRFVQSNILFALQMKNSGIYFELVKIILKQNYKV